MGDKLTVVACETNAEKGGYDVLLSNGETVHSPGGAYPVGAEYTTEQATAGITAPHVLTDAEVQKLVEENAALQRRLDEARGALADLSAQNGRMAEEIVALKQRQGEAKVPASLFNVQTRDVADLPRLDQLQAAPIMDVPEITADDRTDVEKHLAAKRAAREANDTVDRALPEGTIFAGTETEGAKP